MKATEQTQVTPATDPEQQSMQSIGADSDDPSDNEQTSMADGGTTDDFDTPD